MHVIGVDLGGTKLAAAIFDGEGLFLQKKVTPLAKRQGKEVGRLIGDEIGHLLTAGRKKGYSITGIGISVPGIYFSERGSVWAPNIPGWDEYPLLGELRSVSGLKDAEVRIDSDRACYILGETWRGKAQGCRNAIFVAIGTGIGAGILVDGRILRGHGDIAGAIGWMGLDRPFRDVYRSCGCFEYHGSGEGIARVARELLTKEQGHKSLLAQKESSQITSYDVFDAYQQNDVLAIKVFDHCIEFWGMSVANLISIFNPEKIILGGGVFGPAARFLDRIIAEALKWAQPISSRQVSIEVSSLGDDAGLIGAGKLALL